MKLRFLFFITSITFLILGCKNSTQSVSKKASIKLDFAYALPVQLIFYSLKFTSGDTVYIKEHFQPQTDTSSYAILNKEERLKIDSIIMNMNLSALDTRYDSHVIDGEEYKLNISKNDTLKEIFIHESEVPGELSSLIDYITELKTKLKRYSLDKRN